ncbi:hypothetical protein RF11_16340 [Thelohanellus kitauei]|uniref:DDE-1 domain-containing protein n=1 Tax=Thelohanellus kitauei TaxID=669202 RepID=A0A0C2M0N3_THEKT|nr:hypothetical protein RF11_16340 [Thelohanellus kitauei]
MISHSSDIALLDKFKCQSLNTSYRRLAEITDEVNCLMNWYGNKGKQEHSKKSRGEGSRCPRSTRSILFYCEWKRLKYQPPNIESRSESLAKKPSRNYFKATDSWLSRWKPRHNITFKKAHHEKGSADNENNFCPDDIYDAHETGLCYRSTPVGFLCYKHIALSVYKKAMDRVTMLCCTNTSGTDKRKLLIIGNSARPRCFKRLRMERLPVEYQANKNA